MRSSLLMTKHCHNWKSERMITEDGIKTVCNLRRPVEAIAQVPQEISCDTCILRVFREGQNRRLDEDHIREWTWAELGATEPPCTEIA